MVCASYLWPFFWTRQWMTFFSRQFKWQTSTGWKPNLGRATWMKCKPIDLKCWQVTNSTCPHWNCVERMSRNSPRILSHDALLWQRWRHKTFCGLGAAFEVNWAGVFMTLLRYSSIVMHLIKQNRNPSIIADFKNWVLFFVFFFLKPGHDGLFLITGVSITGWGTGDFAKSYFKHIL